MTFLRALPLALLLSGTSWLGSTALNAGEPSDVVPPGWLTLPHNALVLDVRHEDLEPGCDQRAGELTQSILDELLNSGRKISFTREFVQAELDYLRANLETDPSRKTAEALIQSFQSALQTGTLDWEKLRELHISAPDSDTVARHLPWLSSRSDMGTIRLADATPSPHPILHLAFKWSSIPMRGAVSTSRNRGRDQRVYTGKGLAWKFGADVRLHQQGTNLFTRSYPAPAWKASYVTVESRPLFVNTQTLLQDLKKGLVPPPAPVPTTKQKRK